MGWGKIGAVFIFFLAAIGPLTAKAVNLSSDTAYGSSMQTETVSAYGEFGGDAAKEQDPPFNWNTAYEWERSVTPGDGGPDIIDVTNDFSGGLGWFGESNWGLDATLEYSDTPDENLVARGGRMSASYRWDYSPPDQLYSTYLNFKLIGADTNFVEAFSGTEPRPKNPKKTKPVSGTAELRQSQLGFDLTWKATRTWKFDFEVDHYGYNRDVADFENQLNTPLALQMGATGFTNTVGGLARVSYTGGVYWNFAQGWNAKFTETYSLLAADDSISTTVKFTIDDQVTKSLKITVGVERLDSEVLTDTLALLGVSYDL